MAEKIPDDLLLAFSRFVSARIGLYFAEGRWRDLVRGAEGAARDLGLGDARACMRAFLSSAPDSRSIEVLASHLTVGETYFFRDKRAFDALRNRVFRELIHSGSSKEKAIRIWSAGCATGEEAYSIAIVVREMLSHSTEWNVTILATDINPLFLSKALKAEYTEWSFRDAAPHIKESYFRKTDGGRYALLHEIRKMVNFSHHNLVEDSYPSLVNSTNALDVIFCRNVLMYFSGEIQRKVIQKFRQCLVEGGWLIVSPSELSSDLFSDFESVNLPGVTLYRKKSRKQERAFREKPDQAKPREYAGLPEAPSAGPIPVGRYPASPDKTVIRDKEYPEPQPRAADDIAEIRALYLHGGYREAVDRLMSRPELQRGIAGMELLARTLANLGRLGEAERWCEKAIAEDKMNPGSRYLLATILQEQGRIEEAAVSLRRSLYLNPEFVIAHFALGILARQSGDLEGSLRSFRNVIALLEKKRDDDPLPESDGITAGRLREITKAMTEAGAAA